MNFHHFLSLFWQAESKFQFKMVLNQYNIQRFYFLVDFSNAGRDWGQEEKGTTEDEMAGWHH